MNIPVGKEQFLMNRSVWIVGFSILVLALFVSGCGDESPCGTGGDGVIRYPVVVMETSLGDIVIELCRDESPVTVRNFLEYVEDGFYDGLIFHRVIPGFLIQGGGYDEDLISVPTRNPIPNEADNGLSNLRGTISMCRTIDIDSATSQFFINTVDNTCLDYIDDTWFGYCVFGRVIEGMSVVDAICEVETGVVGDYHDVPVEPVFINHAFRRK